LFVHCAGRLYRKNAWGQEILGDKEFKEFKTYEPAKGNIAGSQTAAGVTPFFSANASLAQQNVPSSILNVQ